MTTREEILADAEKERHDMLEREAVRHSDNITTELRRYLDARRHIESVYRLRLTALPENLAIAPIQDAVLAVLDELPLDSEGMTDIMITGRLIRAGRQPVTEADVKWALNAMLIRKLVTFSGSAGGDDPVRWMRARPNVFAGHHS